MLCDPTWQHSFYQIFSSPLATHALRPDLTTFLLSNFFPPLGNPCFQMIQVQVQHSFYQIFPPPPWQPMLCDPTWQHSFYQIFLHPLGKPCFATLPDNIPFIKFFPRWQPMLSMIQVQVQHSFYQFFPPPWQPMLSMIQVFMASPLCDTHSWSCIQ